MFARGPTGGTAFEFALEDLRIVLGTRIDIVEHTGELPRGVLVPPGVDMGIHAQAHALEEAFGRLALPQHLTMDDPVRLDALCGEEASGDAALLLAEIGQPVIVIGAERRLSMSDQIQHAHESPHPRREARKTVRAESTGQGWGTAGGQDEAPRLGRD